MKTKKKKRRVKKIAGKYAEKAGVKCNETASTIIIKLHFQMVELLVS